MALTSPAARGAGTLPSTSRAAVLTEYKKPLEMQDLPIPEVEPGALLVKIDVTTLCGSDVHLWQGELTQMEPVLPSILGHEYVGRVVRIGAGAERDAVGNEIRIGDRVVWEHEACGACYGCSVKLDPALCTNRRWYMWIPTTEFPYLGGGFTEYCYILPRAGRLRVPDELKSEWAAASSCALRTVIKSMGRIGKIEQYETVVVQGIGPLGVFATAIAARAGARKVIAIGGPPERAELALEYGADEVIPLEGTDPESRAERVLELTDGHGADVVLEYSGGPGAFNEGLDFARLGGRYLVVGQVGDQAPPVQPAKIAKKQISVIGSWSANISHYWQALDWMVANHERLDFDKMISGRYSLDEATTALERMGDFSEMKPAVYPGGLT